MHIEILRQGPFRPPTWRHDYVSATLGAGKGLADQYTDPAITIYRRFLLAHQAAGSDEEARDRVCEAFPNAGRAFQLFYDPDPEDRRHLEARLLTTESLQQIADRFQITASAVEHFEQIFFHVRDRLSSPDWVRNMLLKPPSSDWQARGENLSDEHRWYVYRMFAYYGGPQVLDAVMHPCVPAEKPQSQDQVVGWINEYLHAAIPKDACVGAALDSRTDTRVVKLALGMNRKADAADDPEVPNPADDPRRYKGIFEAICVARPDQAHKFEPILRAIRAEERSKATSATADFPQLPDSQN